MTGSEIAALIVATTGALAAIFAGVRNLRGDKFKKDVDASASLLTGYTNMVTALQNEIDRIKSDYAEDRAAFTGERIQARQEHREEMEELRAAHRAELLLAYERIDEIGAQLYVMQNRPPESHERRGD